MTSSVRVNFSGWNDGGAGPKVPSTFDFCKEPLPFPAVKQSKAQENKRITRTGIFSYENTASQNTQFNTQLLPCFQYTKVVSEMQNSIQTRISETVQSSLFKIVTKGNSYFT